MQNNSYDFNFKLCTLHSGKSIKRSGRRTAKKSFAAILSIAMLFGTCITPLAAEVEDLPVIDAINTVTEEDPAIDDHQPETQIEQDSSSNEEVVEETEAESITLPADNAESNDLVQEDNSSAESNLSDTAAASSEEDQVVEETIQEEQPVDRGEENGLDGSENENSEWLNDYTYRISGDVLVLTAYNGRDTSVTVPGQATVDGVEYSRIQVTASVFRNKTGIKSIFFGQGVEFPEYAGSMFSGMRN